MFTENDMIDFASAYAERRINDLLEKKGFAEKPEQLIEEWKDLNPVLVATQDTLIYEFIHAEGVAGISVMVPKGTKFRLMQCDIPEQARVVCDILGEDSPEQKYYWVTLSDTIRQDEGSSHS